jgi:hypothetical protein
MAKRRHKLRLPTSVRCLSWVSLICFALSVQSVQACLVTSLSSSETKKIVTSIPRGTILPVRLNGTLSSEKSKPHQLVTASIMQNVPLPNGSKIPKGSKVEGRILEVIPESGAQRGRISIQFDTLHFSQQVIPIAVNLRAIAGFVEIFTAQTPASGPGFGDVFRWMTTKQVGGDVVYGDGGPVTSAWDGEEVLGKSVRGGVLVRVRPNERLGCPIRVDDNDRPQALWVFSSDACGTYGLAHVQVPHSGRTDPVGVITFASDVGKLKIQSGAGMLLRVD